MCYNELNILENFSLKSISSICETENIWTQHAFMLNDKTFELSSLFMKKSNPMMIFDCQKYWCFDYFSQTIRVMVFPNHELWEKQPSKDWATNYSTQIKYNILRSMKNLKDTCKLYLYILHFKVAST